MLSMMAKFIRQQYRQQSFRSRILLLLVFFVVLQVVLLAFYSNEALKDTLHEQISNRALMQAKAIAIEPLLIKNIEQKNYEQVNKEVSELTNITDADFIVIGDAKGIRITHPDPEKIGLPMQGNDNYRVLHDGKEYFSTRRGSLGMSIRGKAPIFSADGNILGVVSVGYLSKHVQTRLSFYSTPIYFALFISFILSLFGTWFITKHIRNRMFGMEPEEIAISFQLQKSILQAVYEGVIAVDHHGNILAVNKRALNILGISHTTESLTGKSISEYVTPYDFFMGISFSGEVDSANIEDQVIACNGETLIASRVNILEHNKPSGWVVSFRKRDDINSLTSQLTQIRQHADHLRVVSHEYTNRLSTISGLIQIGAYDDAVAAIRNETENHQQFIDYITQTFRSKVIAGLLLGKYCRAKELGLTLSFDPLCHLGAKPTKISINELATVIGNLLENAFEATLINPDSNKDISLLLSDSNNELTIEIADNGLGISDAVAESMFTKGVSTKKADGHGIGLYLVHFYVTNAGGVILIDKAEPQGTIFSLFIPN